MTENRPKRLTLKAVNAAIRARGIDATLEQDKESLYFWGTAVEWAYSSTVSVYRLNHLTMTQWMAELDRIVQDSTERRPEGYAPPETDAVSTPNTNAKTERW